MSATIPFYPWHDGDHLYASALNAAIANSVALGGDNKNFRTPYDFGAKGSTATVWNDDTAALNNAFAQTAAEGGGRIYFPDIFYAAGALTVPEGIEIYGNFTPTAEQFGTTTTYFHAPGSKLILGTSGITLGRACTLRNIMVISATAPQTNPTNTTQAQAVVTAMASAGTGITLVGDNCLLDSLQVLGFNYGIFGTNTIGMNRIMMRNIHGDCNNCIHLSDGGDTLRIQGAHFWPYLTVMAPGAVNQRPGVGIYTARSGCTVPIEQVTIFGWQTCFQCDNDSVSWVQCWADGNAPQSTGYATTGACGVCQMIGCFAVANQFGVHHSPSNGSPFHISGGTSFSAGGPGGSTPATGMSICVYADGHAPVQCIGATFGGGQTGFWLGPNTGSSVIIGNVFDDTASDWGQIYSVDPAVIPNLTKHSNRVINSPRGLTEQVPPNLANGLPLYDHLPNTISTLTLNGNMNVAGVAATDTVSVASPTGSALTPPFRWYSHTNPADENIWDIIAGASSLAFRAVNDGATAATNYFSITRTGYTNIHIAIIGSLNTSGPVGFNGAGALPKPTVSGAKGGNTALASLLSALVAYGLITDSSSA